MNMFTCKICGEQVSKRQSLSYQDGRACRVHSEVSESAAQKIATEAQRIQNEQKKVEEKRQYHQHRFDPYKFDRMENQCWICGCEGTHLRDIYLQQMVNMEKIKITAEATGEKINILKMMDRSNQMVDRSKPILVPVEVPDDKIFLVERRIKSQDLAPLVGLTKGAQLCGKCIKELGLSWKPPEVTPDQLVASSVMYDMTLKPIVQKVAEEQLASEAKMN